MNRLLVSLAVVVAAGTSLVGYLVQNPVTNVADRGHSAWYQHRRAQLEESLRHAEPKSSRAFKLASKLSRLENWRQNEPKMGFPEEFARILYEMKVPDDRSVPEYRPGYLYREREMALRRANPQTKVMSWQSRGPGNVAGRARVIVVDPDDPTGNTWFIASAGGGVWHTADAGLTWAPMMDGQPVLAVQSLAMAPSNTSVLYAGTGESYFNIDTMNGNGILKSIDKGATWTQLSSTASDSRFNNVSRIIVSPTDPNVVVVSTTVGRYLSSLDPATYIFRSVDGGTSWSQVYTVANSGGFSGPRVQQLLADPTDFNIQYAAVHQLGILKSIDAGVTWTPISVGITDLSGRFEMAISPVDPNVLFVSAEGTAGAKLWASWNGGTSWQNLSNSSGVDWLGGQGWYDNTIICHPTDSRIVFVGGTELYQLTANSVGGNSFTGFPLASYWYPHPDHHYLQIVQPAAGAWYLLGTNDGGVTRTNPGGVTGFTTPTNGMVTTQFYGVDKRPGASEYLGGTQDNGTWQSGPNPVATDSWSFRIGGDGYETSWHFDDPQKMMGGYQYNGLQRSLDGGVTWSSATNGMTDTGSGNAPFITKIGKSWKRPDDVYAVGAQGVWHSADFGATWTLASIPGGQWGGMSSFHDVRVSAADPNIVWAGARMNASGDIMVSIDAGASFSPAIDYTATVTGVISGMATHPTQPNTAYVLFSFAGRPKVLKTTDLGQTWSDISGFGTGSVSNNGFPDVAVYDLMVWPNDPLHIWVGSEIGLIESLDGGTTWALANNGLPAVGVWTIKAVEDEIVVGTHGRGIWTTTVPALVNGQVFNPLFESMGQAPGGDLDLQFNLRSAYDSTQVWVDGAKVVTLSANTPLSRQTVQVPVLAQGTATAFALSFSGGVTHQSATKQSDVFPMSTPVMSYTNNLDNSADVPLVNNGFSRSTPAGFANPALNTPHFYANGASYTSTLMVPIMMSTLSTLSFDEIALVEAGDPGSVFGDNTFWDYVIVEGTSDGVHWLALTAGWDARDDASWLGAYNAGQAGSPAMYRTRQIVLNNTFAPGQTILVRWRLFADAAVTGWGWAVDNINVTSSGVTAVADTPRATLLQQNYPNPFNPVTSITFEIPTAGKARLQIYDPRGHLVRTLLDGEAVSGSQTLIWDGRDDTGRAMASGVYLYRLQAGDVVQQRKMTLVK